MVEIPRKLNGRQKELLKEFAESENKSILPQTSGFFEKLKKYFGNNK